MKCDKNPIFFFLFLTSHRSCAWLCYIGRFLSKGKMLYSTSWPGKNSEYFGTKLGRRDYLGIIIIIIIYNAQINSEPQMRTAAIKCWKNNFSLRLKLSNYQSIAVQLEGCSMSWVHEQRKTMTRSLSRSSERTTCMCLQTASAADKIVRLPACSPQRDTVARNRTNICRLVSPPWKWCAGGQVTSAGHDGRAWYGQ